LDGAAFIIADGSEIRLAGILSPGADGEAASREAVSRARAALDAVLRQGAVTLAEQGQDRYGRVLAEVFVDGVWAQESLLRQGEVRAAPDNPSAVCAGRLLKAEDAARSAHAGHWQDGLFAVRTPEQLGSRTGSFQIVEGTVVTAAQVKGRAYINFGADYRSDFTFTVAPEDMKAFRQAKFDVKALAGKRVRVRGWLESFNGPEMEIATPAAIERLN
jgi:hypothetical protein